MLRFILYVISNWGESMSTKSTLIPMVALAAAGLMVALPATANPATARRAAATRSVKQPTLNHSVVRGVPGANSRQAATTREVPDEIKSGEAGYILGCTVAWQFGIHVCGELPYYPF